MPVNSNINRQFGCGLANVAQAPYAYVQCKICGFARNEPPAKGWTDYMSTICSMLKLIVHVQSFRFYERFNSVTADGAMLEYFILLACCAMEVARSTCVWRHTVLEDVFCHVTVWRLAWHQARCIPFCTQTHQHQQH